MNALWVVWCIIAATWETLILGKRPDFEPVDPTEDTP